ncbi:MAG: hypothetical protein ACKOPS_11580 [Cyanobium sp.]
MHANELQVHPLAGQARWCDHVIQRTIVGAVAATVQSISANDLNTGGIDAISRALQTQREVGLSVSGELRFVVMEADAYQRLRDCELEVALLETRADLAAGRVLRESVEDHLKRLESIDSGSDGTSATPPHADA